MGVRCRGIGEHFGVYQDPSKQDVYLTTLTAPTRVFIGQLQRTRQGIRPSDYRPCGEIRGWTLPHQRLGKFLVASKAPTRGNYISVEPFHLFRYLDEQVFRYTHRSKKDRPVSDSDRFDIAVRQIVGKRITYKELTGKLETDTVPF